jgi:hypothetical protein
MSDDSLPAGDVDRVPDDESDFTVVYPNPPIVEGDVVVLSGEEQPPPPAMEGDETNVGVADHMNAGTSKSIDDEACARDGSDAPSAAVTDGDTTPAPASFVLHPPTYADTLVFDGLAPIGLAGRFWSRTQVCAAFAPMNGNALQSLTYSSRNTHLGCTCGCLFKGAMVAAAHSSDCTRARVFSFSQVAIDSSAYVDPVLLSDTNSCDLLYSACAATLVVWCVPD